MLANNKVLPYDTISPELTAALKRDGFSHFKKFTDVSLWDGAFACPKVHHGEIERGIENSVLRLNERTGWDTVVTKYRASAACEAQSSNATDAAALHRDLAVYSDEVPPVFTLVIYLDDTRMSVVKGSHAKLRMSPTEAMGLEREELSMQAGDAILFHATLLHAGVFEPGVKNRRVVQCFDMFPSHAYADAWAPRILHLWSTNNDFASGIMSRLTSNSVCKLALSALHLMRTAGGYPIHTPLPDDVDMISGEALRKRLDRKNIDSFQYGNRYVPLEQVALRDATPDENSRIRTAFYGFHDGAKILAAGTLVLVVVMALASRSKRARAAPSSER